jgi:hypothetical protein
MMLDDNRRFFDPIALHFSGEPVAALWHCLDKFLLAGRFAKRLAEVGDVAGESGLFDKGIRPQKRYKLIFVDQTAAVFNEGSQGLKNFVRKLNRFAISEQQTLRRIEQKGSKLVN